MKRERREELEEEEEEEETNTKKKKKKKMTREEREREEERERNREEKLFLWCQPYWLPQGRDTKVRREKRERTDYVFVSSSLLLFSSFFSP